MPLCRFLPTALVLLVACGAPLPGELESDESEAIEVETESSALPTCINAKQWEVVTLPAFTASGTPPAWNANPYPLTATFTNAGTTIAVDGYYDGGATWRVRFTCRTAGQWDWTTVGSAGLSGQSGCVSCVAASAADKTANASYRGHIKKSADSRHFVYDDGTPFLWMGDTNWSLPVSTKANHDLWITNRKARGYTVVIGRMMDLGLPPASGPVTSFPAYTSINPAWFTTLDARFLDLWNKGFVVAAHPDWLFGPSGSGTVQTDLLEAEQISRYLMARYGAYNLVWSLSGEYNGTNVYWTQNNYGRIRQLGAFVDGHNPFNHQITIHPGGDDPGPPDGNIQSSAQHFHTEAWLDHNWVQTYAMSEKVPYRMDEAWRKSPAKPVVLAEGFYENATVGSVTCNDEIIRRQTWNAFLTGAAGHNYGARSIFFLYTPQGTETLPAALIWPGAEDIPNVINFLKGLAVGWQNLVPTVGCVTIGGVAPDNLNPGHPHCAAKLNDTYATYIPVNNQASNIVLQNLGSGVGTTRCYNAQWYNPKTGAYTTMISSPNASSWPLPPRPAPDSQDWVALLTPKTCGSTSLITNGNFEAGATGWNNCSLSTNPAIGLNAAKNPLSVNWEYGFPKQYASSAVPGVSYTFSGKIRAAAITGIGCHLRLTWSNTGFTELRSDFIGSLLTGTSADWISVSGTFVAPPNTAHALINNECGPGTGTVYYDDITFTTP